MWDSSGTFEKDLVQLAISVVTIFRKRPGWGYISLARIGLAIVAFGVSVLVPGLWETVLDWVIQRFGGPGRTTGVQSVSQYQTMIAVILMVVGVGLTLWSALLYHKFSLRQALTTDNDGKVSLNVQPGTSFRTLIQAIAEVNAKSVGFADLPSAEQRQVVTSGPLEASSFEDFLTQAAARVQPPLKIAWSQNANFYALGLG